MKKLVMGLAAALMFFVLLVVVFFVIFFVIEGEQETTDVELMTNRELQTIIEQRDSLLVDVDSLETDLAYNQTIIDSLEQELSFTSATLQGVQDRLQEKDAVIASLRQAEVNAQAMARTFATMTVAEMKPIVARLSDQVVMDIYTNTSTKRKKFLLEAMGNERAAAMASRLLSKKGS
jgi:septal ring factor EnvC (AmiA/AmiB activator)